MSSLHVSSGTAASRRRGRALAISVDELYCKRQRPIQCLASSPPPHRPPTPSSPGDCVLCTPPPRRAPVVRGKDTLAGWRGGRGSIVRKAPDNALYSIYVSILCGHIRLTIPGPSLSAVSPLHIFLWFNDDLCFGFLYVFGI
jgi:hypothetical protein